MVNESLQGSNRPATRAPYSGLNLPPHLARILNTRLPFDTPFGTRVGDLLPIINELPDGQDRISSLFRERTTPAEWATLPAEVIGVLSPLKIKTPSISKRSVTVGENLSNKKWLNDYDPEPTIPAEHTPSKLADLELRKEIDSQFPNLPEARKADASGWRRDPPVSYTHLTLPTSDLV